MRKEKSDDIYFQMPKSCKTFFCCGIIFSKDLSRHCNLHNIFIILRGKTIIENVHGETIVCRLLYVIVFHDADCCLHYNPHVSRDSGPSPGSRIFHSVYNWCLGPEQSNSRECQIGRSGRWSPRFVCQDASDPFPAPLGTRRETRVSQTGCSAGIRVLQGECKSFQSID